MANSNDLSPWAHPKAQHWFYALFRKTNLAMELEDEIRKPVDQLSPEIMRVILAFALLLGRPEMWPENERAVIEAIMKRAREISQTSPKSATGKPLTISEHQQHSQTNSDLAKETEILRRRLGASARKTPVALPKSWEPFWE